MPTITVCKEVEVEVEVEVDIDLSEYKNEVAEIMRGIPEPENAMIRQACYDYQVHGVNAAIEIFERAMQNELGRLIRLPRERS